MNTATTRRPGYPLLDHEAPEANVNEEASFEEIAGLLSKVIDGALLASADVWAKLDVTMPQLKVVMLLGMHGSAPVSWLATRMGVSPPNVTGILDRLEQHRWVQRTSDTHDRRVVRVVLAPEGEHLLQELHAAGDAQLRGIIAGMRPADRAALRRGLAALVRVAAHATPPPEPAIRVHER